MKTRKLYYEDCHMQAFSASVIACSETENGFLVELDATAFYPEGGGQACDLGTLDDVCVLDVQEQGETVLHLCDAPLPVGKEVRGSIDWARRFDLMQQHTGEHIVSGILHAMFGCHNVGFHMGTDVITIDFDTPIPAESLQEVEEKANDAVFRNLPVHCRYPEPEELSALSYRTKKQLSWPVRIVQIPGIDTCACCGIHTAQTGEVGIIKLLSCVKFHEGVRMEMVCGKRALTLLSQVYEQNRQVCQAFSAKTLETGAAARRINDALTAEKYRSGYLERQLFDAIAEGYVNQGDVVHFADSLSPVAVRELAEKIACRCGGTAAVFSETGDGRCAVCLVCKNGSVAELGKRLCDVLGGKGGGKPGFFQGSVNAGKAAIQQFFAG